MVNSTPDPVMSAIRISCLWYSHGRGQLYALPCRFGKNSSENSSEVTARNQRKQEKRFRENQPLAPNQNEPICPWTLSVLRLFMNKSAQSNLGRGPRRGAVAHVRGKVPIGYNGAPQIRPKSTPYRGPIAKPHHLPHP